MRGEIEVLVSVPHVARLAGRDRTTMLRLLGRMAEQDRATPAGCDWLLQEGPRRKMRVNLSRLEAAHPALFKRRYVSRDEYDQVLERLGDIENQLHDGNTKTNALSASIRVVKQALRALQAAATGGTVET
jgi:hypothetical protein